MRYILIAIIVQIYVFLPLAESHAGVAQASTSHHTGYLQHYDFSDLNPQERRWFIKFIEGTFFTDGWQEIASDILVSLPDEIRQEKKRKLLELGNKIGREWCKDNDIRRIDTGMLKKWGDMLKSASRDKPHHLLRMIEHINSEVDSIID